MKNVGISIVIPYVSTLAQGEELRLAIQSWEKFFKEEFHVIVIGDSEDWFSKNERVFHIPHARMSENPQADVIDKIKAAIASELVTDAFIFTNDDIYLVSPVTGADVAVLKSKGELNPGAYSGVYKENMEGTIKLLAENKLGLHDFATHTPVLFEKEKLVTLFEVCPELNQEGYLLSSVYFNYFFAGHVPVLLNWETDNWLLPVRSKQPDEKKFDALVKRKKFLNNTESGYSVFLMGRINWLTSGEG